MALFILAMWALVALPSLSYAELWLSLSALCIGMAALTADRITQKKLRGLKSYPMAAAVKIFAGSMVAINASGFAAPAADTVDFKVVGVAQKTVDNSAGANGDLNINVEAPVIARYDASSILQVMVGKIMYVLDDHTFTSSLGGSAVKAGRLVEFISTSEGWIEIEESGKGLPGVDAGATYTASEQTIINKLKEIINNFVLG